MWVHYVEQRGGSAPWSEVFEAIATDHERIHVFNGFVAAKKAGLLRSRADQWVQLASRDDE